MNCLIGLKWHLAEQLAVLNRNLLKISLSKSLLKTLLQFIKERSIGEISPEAVKTKHDCVKENCIKLMKDEIKEITFGLSDVLLKRTKSFFEVFCKQFGLFPKFCFLRLKIRLEKRGLHAVRKIKVFPWNFFFSRLALPALLFSLGETSTAMKVVGEIQGGAKGQLIK